MIRKIFCFLSAFLLFGCSTSDPYKIKIKFYDKGFRGDTVCDRETDSSAWDNCSIFRRMNSPGASYEGTFRYENGVRHGKYESHDYDFELRKYATCEGTYQNGKVKGLSNCKSYRVSDAGSKYDERKYKLYDGKKDPEREKKEKLAEYGDTCVDLGFVRKTPEYGNCILKILEIEQRQKQQGDNALSRKEQELMDLQITREKQNQTDRKIEGALELLELLSGEKKKNGKTNDTELTTTDLKCLKNCQATGKSYMLCKKRCTY